jgi:hypothetical protein
MILQELIEFPVDSEQATQFPRLQTEVAEDLKGYLGRQTFHRAHAAGFFGIQSLKTVRVDGIEQTLTGPDGRRTNPVKRAVEEGSASKGRQAPMKITAMVPSTSTSNSDDSFELH